MIKYRSIAVLGSLLAGITTFGAIPAWAHDGPPLSSVAGTWTVTGVEVSNTGIQALGHDDPSYMGKQVRLNATRFTWMNPTTSGGAAGDVCANPRLRRVALPSGPEDDRIAMLHSKPVTAFAVTCASGSWGPHEKDEPALYQLANGSLALDWYDSGLLLLKKTGAAATSPADAPLPASASDTQVPVERIRASIADPRVGDYDYSDVVLNGGAETRGAPLVVFLPGTGGGENGGPHLLEETVARQGLRVIFLPYDNLPAAAQVCPRRPPGCYGRFRASRIFGGDGATVATPPAEAIVSRLAAVLRYLDREHPEAGWRNYLDATDMPAWPNIVVSGLSQGAGMAAFIAKRFPVRRVVLFSSPWDAVGREKVPAPWLYQPSATPPERWWAERHARENTTQLIANAYDALGIPPTHQFVFDRILGPDASGPNPYHRSTVSQPMYVPQWRTMFGSAGGSDE